MKIPRPTWALEFAELAMKRVKAGPGTHVAWLLDSFETKLKADSQHDHRPSTAKPAGRPHACPVYVAYDISENRRRHRLRRLLLSFGEPVQESVFLCWLDAVHQKRFDTLLGAFRRLPHKGTERIDCIPARAGSLPAPAREWVFE